MPELADQKDRIQALLESAEKVVPNDEYYAALSPEQLDLKREQFSLNAIELNKIAEKKKEKMDEFKEQMKPLEVVYDALLAEITMGKEKREGRLFILRDDENSIMATYDENGDWVSDRRQTPEEKTGGRPSIFMNKKAS